MSGEGNRRCSARSDVAKKAWGGCHGGNRTCRTRSRSRACTVPRGWSCSLARTCSIPDESSHIGKHSQCTATDKIWSVSCMQTLNGRCTAGRRMARRTPAKALQRHHVAFLRVDCWHKNTHRMTRSLSNYRAMDIDTKQSFWRRVYLASSYCNV